MTTDNKDKKMKIVGREPFGWNLGFMADSFWYGAEAWDKKLGLVESPSTPCAMEVV